MTIARCRVNDSTCAVSPKLAPEIVAAVKAGKYEADRCTSSSFSFFFFVASVGFAAHLPAETLNLLTDKICLADRSRPRPRAGSGPDPLDPRILIGSRIPCTAAS